jgi:arabinofuranosyltransferase
MSPTLAIEDRPPDRSEHDDAGSMTTWRERLTSPDVLWAVGVAVASMAMMTYYVWWTRGFTPDDAYITMRYARNLADGHGWTYNLGDESGNGATSALYVLVLAALQVVHAGPETNANLVSILAVTLSATAIFVLLRARVSTAAGLLAAGLLVWNPWYPLARSMESALLLGLVSLLLALAFLTRPTNRVAQVSIGVVAGLMLLTRGEAIVMALLVLAYLVVRDRRVPWAAVIGGAAVLGVWAVAAWALIGSPIPVTLGAKMAQARSGYWGSEYAFLTDWTGPIGGLRMWAWFWFLVAGVALAVAGAWRRPQLRWLVGVVAGYGIATYLLVGVVLRVPGYFWYYSPLVFALVVTGAIGWGWVLSLVRVRGVAIALALVAVALVGAQVREHSPRGYQYGSYGDVAAWLKANTDPTTTVGAAEIGVIGFESERPIIDFLGLLDTRSADDLRAHDLTAWFDRNPPEVFITHQPVWVFEYPTLAEPAFARSYRLEAGGRGMWIFRRQGGADAAAPDGPIIVAPQLFLPSLADEQVMLTGDDERAVQQLAAVFVARPDLQKAFMKDGSVVVVPMLTWARDVSDRTQPDVAAEALTPFAAQYADMAGRADAAGLTSLLFVDPVVPPA